MKTFLWELLEMVILVAGFVVLFSPAMALIYIMSKIF